MLTATSSGLRRFARNPVALAVSPSRAGSSPLKEYTLIRTLFRRQDRVLSFSKALILNVFKESQPQGTGVAS